MAGTVTVAGKKIKELDLADVLNDADDVVIEDSTPKTKRVTLEKLYAWMLEKVKVDMEPMIPNIQKGYVKINTVHNSNGSVTVTFSEKFLKTPHVVISMDTSNETTRNVFVYTKSITESGITIGWNNTNTESSGVDFAPTIYWIAIE